jgi:transposase-like protein
MVKERRKYTKEYKEAALAMTERDDKTVSQAAMELGIDASMLARWRTEARKARDGTVKAFPGERESPVRSGVRLRTRPGFGYCLAPYPGLAYVGMPY